MDWFSGNAFVIVDVRVVANAAESAVVKGDDTVLDVDPEAGKIFPPVQEVALHHRHQQQQ